VGNVQRSISGWTLILPSLILFILIIWRPILIGISYSFFELRGFVPTEFVWFRNYHDILTDTNFLQTLENTVKYVLWSLVIGLPLPFFCAVMLNEMLHMQGYFKISMYLPVIIPSIATSLIWKMVYLEGENGLLNMLLYYIGAEPVGWLSNKSTVIPMIVVSMSWNAFGSTMILYLANLQSINQELYEAARLDGAGFVRRFRHVLFPHMRGILLLMAIRQVIAVFGVTEQPLTMTGGGPNGASMSIGLTNYFYAFKYGHYDKSLALGVVTFCLLLFLTVVYFLLEKKVED